MAESMKDFEKEIEESFKNIEKFNDPDASKWEHFRELLSSKEVFRVKITEVVNGGCVAFVDEVRAFIPAGQLSMEYVEDLNVYQNKNIDVIVITVDEDKRRLVLSHKEIEKEKREKELKKAVSAINTGDVLDGEVESLKDYGAFIKLAGGASGLLHISQISHNRIKHPGVVLKVGDEIKVKVISTEEGKISLSKKALEDDPKAREFENDLDLSGYKYEEKETAAGSLGDLLKNLKLK